MGKKIPLGRTLSTNDQYLGRKKTGSEKKRPVVVVEVNDDDEVAVVPLSSRDGKHRTRLKKYQDGKSFFKHFVEIEDDSGAAIRIDGKKFRANHQNQDLSQADVDFIRDIVFNHSAPAPENVRKILIFRTRKKPRD